MKRTHLDDALAEAERALLGCWMLSSRSVQDTIAMVEPDMFSVGANRLIAEAIKHIHEKRQSPCLISTRVRLAETGKLDAAGGVYYLIECAENCVSPTHDETLASIIMSAAWKRDKIKSLQDVLKSCADGEDADEIQLQLQELSKMSLITSAPITELQAVKIGGGITDGVPTGYPSIDARTSCSGYPRGQTSVWVAYHKAGKSSALMRSAWLCAERGLSVLYGTFADLSKEDIKLRLIKQLCGWMKPPTGSVFELEEFDAACRAVNDAFGPHFTIYDARKNPQARTTEYFAQWVKARQLRQPYDIVFVDYAQKITSRIKGTAYERSVEASAQICDLASDLNIPVVVGSQMTLGGRDGVDATKGGRHWEEDAGLLFRLKREDDRPTDDFGSCDAIIEMPHSRFAPLGKIPARWCGKRVLYEEAA